ncbi:MAG: transposase [Chloroflexi bacterium]|nr:transposase [Chloroflexota bacterium]
MAKVFLSVKLKLRQPTGRKAKVLAEVRRLYAQAVDDTLVLAKERLPELTVVPPEDRKKLAFQNAFPMPAGAGQGLHSSLRNGARLAVLGVVESYLALREATKDGETPPTWPGEAQSDWPDYEKVLDELARIANNEERETELRDELGRASFLAKQERRALGDILWFPAMSAPYRTNYAGLLNDGENWYAMVYVLAPEHPMAKTIKGDGKLVDVENRAWQGRSKCALILPLEIDRHDWQHRRFLNAFLNGEASVQTAQLYQDRRGEWYFTVQSAWKREIAKTDTWLGLAFETAYPILCSSSGQVVQLAGEELQTVAKLDVLLRASLQQRGRDISYHRLHGTASKQVVHLWANLILQIARRNESGVAITGAGRPMLGVPRAKLNQVLRYKGVLAGAPVRFVSSKEAAWVCPACGAEIVKPEKKPWPVENLCGCGQSTSLGMRIAWHLAKRAEAER